MSTTTQRVTLRARAGGPRRKVVLVRPPVTTAKLSITDVTCPPLALAYLGATLEEAGHEVVVVDAVGAAPERFRPFGTGGHLLHGLSPTEVADAVDTDTDVVGVSCMFSQDWPVARRTVEAIRRRCPTALVVAGGEHVTALPEASLADCPALDAVVRGEGEETLLELVAAGRHGDLAGVPGVVARTGEGTVASGPPRGRLRRIDELPRPAWHLTDLPTYLRAGYGFGVDRGRSLPVLATRGCPYRCSFCSNPQMWTTRYETREPAQVLAEIRDGIERHGIVNVDFYDLTFVLRKSWIVEFCQLVIASGLRFTFQLPSGTRSEAIDEEVAGLLYRAGCRNLSYAPESGSPAVLERVHKRVDLERMKTSMRGAVAAGINCKANLIIGFPDETRAEVWATLRFTVALARLGLHDCSITPFSPYPGTELFDELRAAGRIGELDDDYYLGLSYADLRALTSWSVHVGSRELAVYRAAGMALFYGVSFARRPSRLVRLVRQLVRGGPQESKLEQAVGAVRAHHRPPRPAPSAS